MLNVDKITVKRGSAVVLDEVSFQLNKGKTVAVVGESGAGKSTLIAAVLGLVKLAGGEIDWSGRPVRNCMPSLVMQEPRSAFNPTLSLRRSVMEPVVAQRAKLLEGRLEKLCKGLELPVELLDRRPNEVSIGQSQRVGILRALISAPELVLFDEPLSALDAVTQKYAAKLISDLQREEGFASLIVTHDLGYAVAYADELIVLKSGRVEETASPDVFVNSPASNYSRSLRNAAIALGSLELRA